MAKADGSGTDSNDERPKPEPSVKEVVDSRMLWLAGLRAAYETGMPFPEKILEPDVVQTISIYKPSADEGYTTRFEYEMSNPENADVSDRY